MAAPVATLAAPPAAVAPPLAERIAQQFDWEPKNLEVLAKSKQLREDAARNAGGVQGTSGGGSGGSAHGSANGRSFGSGSGVVNGRDLRTASASTESGFLMPSPLTESAASTESLQGLRPARFDSRLASSESHITEEDAASLGSPPTSSETLVDSYIQSPLHHGTSANAASTDPAAGAGQPVTTAAAVQPLGAPGEAAPLAAQEAPVQTGDEYARPNVSSSSPSLAPPLRTSPSSSSLPASHLSSSKSLPASHSSSSLPASPQQQEATESAAQQSQQSAANAAATAAAAAAAVAVVAAAYAANAAGVAADSAAGTALAASVDNPTAAPAAVPSAMAAPPTGSSTASSAAQPDIMLADARQTAGGFFAPCNSDDPDGYAVPTSGPAHDEPGPNYCRSSESFGKSLPPAAVHASLLSNADQVYSEESLGPAALANEACNDILDPSGNTLRRPRRRSGFLRAFACFGGGRSNDHGEPDVPPNAYPSPLQQHQARQRIPPSTFAQKLYAGAITPAASLKMLHKKGDFLVRPSQSGDGFTLTAMTTADNAIHARIYQCEETGRFYVQQGCTFPSIITLVMHYWDTEIGDSNQGYTHLRRPVGDQPLPERFRDNQFMARAPSHGYRCVLLSTSPQGSPTVPREPAAAATTAAVGPGVVNCEHCRTENTANTVACLGCSAMLPATNR
eukprot:m.69369 g.69369  ORF g.69369 m.69369 type:complete len:680 (+) comp13980_c0_seq1:431-2470(+)